MQSTNLQNTVEAICDYTWSRFAAVDDTKEKNWILDHLELASIAADNNNRQYALWWLSSAMERVFGFYSNEYREFFRLFPNMEDPCNLPTVPSERTGFAPGSTPSAC